MSHAREIQTILEAVRGGDTDALDRLFSIAYDELHDRASRELAKLGRPDSLQTSALVNEAYLQLIRGSSFCWEGRRQFYFAAARAMHDVIVDHLRRSGAQKRGAGWRRVDMSVDRLDRGDPEERILDVSDALQELRTLDADAAEVVLLRFFGGLTYEQIADATGSTLACTRGNWAYARAWLARRLAR